MKVFELVPCHGAFESVLDDAERDGQFPRIGHADERLAPSQGSTLVRVSPTPMIADELNGSHYPGIDRVVGRFETENQQCFLKIVNAIVASFLIVQDAQIGGVEARLPDGTHSLGSRKKIRKTEDSTTPKAGPVLQPHPGIDDHAEGPFRADDHTIGAWPGA